MLCEQKSDLSSNCVEGDFDNKQHSFVVGRELIQVNFGGKKVNNAFAHRGIYVAINTDY